MIFGQVECIALWDTALPRCALWDTANAVGHLSILDMIRYIPASKYTMHILHIINTLNMHYLLAQFQIKLPCIKL